MGTVVRFSEFDSYLFNLKNKGERVEGTILDANIIITLSFSPKKFHTRVSEFIRNKILANNMNLYSTVNTTQEFLEFHRRLLLTEGLRTAIHPSSRIKLPNKKRSVIRAQSSILDAREKNNGSDPVFYDREIKKIRDVFCHSGPIGMKLWKTLCDIYLRKQLQLEYKALQKLNVNYLSSYKTEMEDLFHQNITWESAIDICTDVGVGFSDAMILNALQSTHLPFSISLDMDIADAVRGKSSLKDVVMPDELVDKL